MMKKIINDSPCGGPVSAPLAGGRIEFGQIVEVMPADAEQLVASGHFREATKEEVTAAAKAASKAAADSQEG